jgi:hypothetical protein
MLKRKRRSTAFPASALITQAGAEALLRRIKHCRLGLAFALLTRKLIAALIVVINDRGPFNKGRVLDVSATAAKALGMMERGVVLVRADVL